MQKSPASRGFAEKLSDGTMQSYSGLMFAPAILPCASTPNVALTFMPLSLTVAVLDRRFAAEAARYPEITAVLFDRLSERSVRLATTQAISQLTRVDRRLKALFWHLAERWGRVSGDGVIVPLALTHRILGQLVGARRPTVSTALSELAEREELIRRPDGSWLLRGDPPDAESLARKPGQAGASAARGQDLMRPARRFQRGDGPDPEAEAEAEVVTAIDRLREALEPGELRELLDRRRHNEPDDAA